ncbi:MAG: hypothetical protein IKG53_03510 [Solobacterium sp.]|nr:hypothetical protein [Solobacterium sp.]
MNSREIRTIRHRWRRYHVTLKRAEEIREELQRLQNPCLSGSGIVHVAQGRHCFKEDEIIGKMMRKEKLTEELKACNTLIQAVRSDMNKLPYDSQKILLLLAWSERIPLANLAEIYGLSRRRMQEMIHAAAMAIVA